MTLKLNTILKYLKPHNLINYFVLAGFCFNLTVASLPLASAQDKNIEDYNLIALQDTQNPEYSANAAQESQNGEEMFVESICTPGVDCPEDLIIKSASVQSGYKKTVVTPITPAVVGKRMTVLTTAYSSTPDQTDASPFITANGTYVRDGIIACNFLPFGAKVKFPDYSGDKIYTVADRMAKKNSHKMDIWMETRAQALQFGVKKLTVEVLE